MLETELISVISPLEREVMKLMLAGEYPFLKTLEKQLEACTEFNRRLSGVGFFLDFNVPEESTLIKERSRFIIRDVYADADPKLPNVDFHGAGFWLFINGGRLSMLEGAGIGSCWPKNADELLLPNLSYVDGERDVDRMARE